MLVLGRGGYLAVSGQGGKEVGDFRFGHVARVSLALEKNEPSNPVRVGLVGSEAEVFSLDDIADLVEEFRLVARGSRGYVLGHAPQSGNFPSRKQL